MKSGRERLRKRISGSVCIIFFFKSNPCSCPFSCSGLLAVSEGLEHILPDICMSPSLLSFRSELRYHPFCKSLLCLKLQHPSHAYPSIPFPCFVSFFVLFCSPTYFVFLLSFYPYYNIRSTRAGIFTHFI